MWESARGSVDKRRAGTRPGDKTRTDQRSHAENRRPQPGPCSVPEQERSKSCGVEIYGAGRRKGRVRRPTSWDKTGGQDSDRPAVACRKRGPQLGPCSARRNRAGKSRKQDRMERGKTHQAIFRPLINGMVSRRPHRTGGRETGGEGRGLIRARQRRTSRGFPGASRVGVVLISCDSARVAMQTGPGEEKLAHSALGGSWWVPGRVAAAARLQRHKAVSITDQTATRSRLESRARQDEGSQLLDLSFGAGVVESSTF